MQRASYDTQLLLSYILLLFWGVLGAHRFFNRHWISGILYACTGAFCGLGIIVDIFYMPQMVRTNLNST